MRGGARRRRGHRRGLARQSPTPGDAAPEPVPRGVRPDPRRRGPARARATASSPPPRSTDAHGDRRPDRGHRTSPPSPPTSPAAAGSAPPLPMAADPDNPFRLTPREREVLGPASPRACPTARSAPASSSATAPSSATSPASSPSSTPPAAPSSPPSPTASTWSSRPLPPMVEVRRRAERLSLETPAPMQGGEYVGRACRARWLRWVCEAFGLRGRPPLGQRHCGGDLRRPVAVVDRCGRGRKNFLGNSSPHPCQTRGFRAWSVGGRCLS